MTETIAKIIHKNTVEIKHPIADSYVIIRALEPTVVNVKISKSPLIDLPTYTITPYDTVLPYEGLSRYHTQGFHLTDYKLDENNYYITIETTQLKLVIDKQNFKLHWYQKDKDNHFQSLFSDRETQAYHFDIADNHPTCHYISRIFFSIYNPWF